jgi:hypothetical protein
VPCGVDPEAVDPVAADPVAVDRGEAVADRRLLREQVVEPEEVALLEALRATAREVDVAAVVVAADVVQPRGALEGAVGGEDERRPRHVRRPQARERAAGRVARRIEPAPAAVAVRSVRVACTARREDHVARVVDDDVEVHLHSQPVRALDERAELLVGAEVRIDGREVDAPVAVVCSARRLDGALLERRRDPDRREAEVTQPREALSRIRAVPGEPAKVAAVEPARIGRVVAGHVPGPGEPTAVVRRFGVLVPVRHHEVDALRRDRRPRRRLSQRREL